MLIGLAVFPVLLAAPLFVASAQAGESAAAQCVDLSVSGITLLSAEGVEKLFGGAIELAASDDPLLRKAVYLSRGKDETLTVLFRPGDRANCFTEMVVRSVVDAPEGVPVLEGIEHFESGKGIKLGMGKEALLKILGTPAGSSGYGDLGARRRVPRTMRGIKHRYVARNLDSAPAPDGQSQLEYFGEYKFIKGTLVEFRVGFAPVAAGKPVIPRAACVSISGMELLNAESVQAVLGEGIKVEAIAGSTSRQAVVMNSNSHFHDKLTLVAHPGDAAGQFSEMIVEKVGHRDLGLPVHRILHWDADRGIRLRISPPEHVIELLGEPTETIKGTGRRGGVTLRYVITEDEAPEFLKHYGRSTYFAEYALGRFRIGFSPAK